jgi:hypothetical protein
MSLFGSMDASAIVEHIAPCIQAQARRFGFFRNLDNLIFGGSGDNVRLLESIRLSHAISMYTHTDERGKERIESIERIKRIEEIKKKDNNWIRIQ